MFKKIVAISALSLASMGALAQTATPRVDQRQENQARRIDQGQQSGALTTHESATLGAREDRIAANEAKAKADGTVTPAERAKLRGEERRTSRSIYRKKHNLRTAATPAG